jgi:hypothetical protein
MQTKEIKNKISIGNVNQMLKEQLFKDNYVKIAIYIGASVAGLFAFGFVLKSVNYAARNFKNLSATLKR